MANYELYLIVLLCFGLIVLTVFVCIWVMLSTSKLRGRGRILPGLSKIGRLVGGVPPVELKAKEEESTSALEREGSAVGAPLHDLEAREKESPSALEPEGLIKTTLPWEQLGAELEGSSGAILQAYAKAVKTVERMTKISMNSKMTLREFLEEVRPNIDGAAEAFAELTTLAERALYAPYAPDEALILAAQNLETEVSLKEQQCQARNWKPGSEMSQGSQDSRDQTEGN